MTDTPTTDLTEEGRLKGIIYQFMRLHDRLSEDRHDAAKQRANTAALVKLFTEQVKGFRAFAPQVQREIAETIAAASYASAKRIGEVVYKAATEKIDTTTATLQQAVDLATHRLNTFENKTNRSRYYDWVALFGMAMITGFLVGKLAMPTPYLALTGQELRTYQSGQLLEDFWPKLSKKEQSRLVKLARTAIQEETSTHDNMTDAVNNNAGAF